MIICLNAPGDVFYKWLLLPCTDCRTPAECKRYFRDLMAFLKKPSTIHAVKRPCIAAVRKLAHKMYTNRVKFSGFSRMFLKDVVSAMTTSPVEGQIGESRKTGINAATPLQDSMTKLVGRADRNLDERDLAAHQELASVNHASCSPTNQYLIRRGEYLVCRCHDERLPLKSAQITSHTWMTWDNSCVEMNEFKNPLFAEITKILRVNHQTLSRDEKGHWFVKCSCGVREDIGVPCGCFFRIADTAGVPMKDIIDICMVSPKYLKVFQTHYGTNTKIASLLYDAQRQAFADKDKGIRITDVVAGYLLNPSNRRVHAFPWLGKDTLPSHYVEARHMMKYEACTRADLILYRRQKAASSNAVPDSMSSNDKNASAHGPYGNTLIESNLTAIGHLTPGAQKLQQQLEESTLTTPVGRKLGQLRTKTEQSLYSKIDKHFTNAQASVLREFTELTKHNLDERIIERTTQKCLDAISGCEERLHDILHAAAASPVKTNTNSANPGQLKLAGEEDASYVSPDRLRRRRGAAG